MNFKVNRKIIISLIALGLFGIVTITLLLGYTTNLDNEIHKYIVALRNETLTNIMLIITNICSVLVLTIISIALILFLKQKRISSYIMLNLVNSIVLSHIFKIIIRRERPIEINLIEESGFSYPSGHSIVSMAFFGLLAYLIYKNMKNKVKKTLLIISLLITICLIGFSRIYLGVHYFSDVLGGFLFSISYLMIFINITKLNQPFI